MDLRSLPVPGSGTGVRERAKTAQAHCACHDLKSRQPKGFCCKNSEWLEDAFLCPSYAVLTWRLRASIATTSASALGRPRRPVQRYAATHRMSASRLASTDSRCGSSGNWVSQKRGRNRHEQSLHHDVRDLTAPHCPTDDARGIEIDDDRQIGKPLAGPDIGDVGAGRAYCRHRRRGGHLYRPARTTISVSALRP